MFEISKIIEDSMDVPGVDRKKIIKILSDSIKNKCDEFDTYKCLYKEIYKDELIPEFCVKWIEKMGNEESSGMKWSLEDTTSVAKRLDIDFSKYTPYEFMVVMTMEYYEHVIPLRKSNITLEPTTWGRIADHWLTHNPKKKLIDDFFRAME